MLAAVGWTVLVGWLPLPDALLRELENRHPAPVDVAARQLQAYTGVVVLGGSAERLIPIPCHEITETEGSTAQLREHKERMVSGICVKAFQASQQASTICSYPS